MRRVFSALISGGLFLAMSACATEHVPIAARLTVTEAAEMTCADLAQERFRAERVRADIRTTEDVNWSHVLGIVGNAWPGNARERVRAEHELDARIADIESARSQKNCPRDPAPAAEAAAGEESAGEPSQ